VSEGLPGVELILTRGNEQLVFELLELGRARLHEQALASAAALRGEKRSEIATILLEFVKDFLPLEEKVACFVLGDSLLNVAFFKVKDVASDTRELHVGSLEFFSLGQLVDME